MGIQEKMKLISSLVGCILGQQNYNQGYYPHQGYNQGPYNQPYQPYQPYQQGYQPNQGYQPYQPYQPYNPHQGYQQNNGRFRQENNFGQQNTGNQNIGNRQNQNCFESHTDIDGNFFRTNVVANLHVIGSVQLCQQECQRQAGQGCEYFVWEKVSKECSLYTDIEHIEYDDDEDEGKTVGPGYGCLPCYKPGWDYVQTGSGQNLIQYGAIDGVRTTMNCALICSLVPECSFWTHETEDQSCQLFKGSASSNMESDYDYNSGAKNCMTSNCIMRGQRFVDGWVTSHKVIGSGSTAMIPKVTDPRRCQSICQLVDTCEYFTVDVDDMGCYLTSSAYALEYSSDKISGPKSC